MRFRSALASIAGGAVWRRPIHRGVAVTVIVALLAAFACGYWLYSGRGSADQPNLMCVTPACGYHARRRLAVGQVLPFRCPRCGQRSVYGTHLCKHCGTAVVLNRQRGIDTPTYCPNCGQEVRRGR